MNKAILKGNLGGDPETRTLSNGKIVSSFSLATTERYNDQDYTEWHNCEAWGKTAEFIARNFKKGQSALVEGKIKYSHYEDKSGETKWKTTINIEKIYFVGTKNQ